MRRFSGVLVGAALAVGPLIMIGVVPAGGEVGAFHPRLQINTVVNAGGGFPTGSLQIRRECSPAGNATSADSALFTVSTVDLMTGTGSFLESGQSCVVSVLQPGGMTVSFGCATADSTLIVCSSNDRVTWVADSDVSVLNRTATVTATFNPPAPAIQVGPSTVAPGAAATISGTACPGGTVSGSVAFAPPLAFGPVTAAADGTWSTSIVVPEGTLSGSYAVNATCTLPIAAEVSAQATFDYEVKFLSVVAAIPAAPSFTG